MSRDLVRRLRRWTHAVDAVPASDLMDEAADEIERLRHDNSQMGRLLTILGWDGTNPPAASVVGGGKGGGRAKKSISREAPR